MASYPSDVALEVTIFFSDANTAELSYEIEIFGENITLPSAVFETYPSWNFYFDEEYQQPCTASTVIYDRVTDLTSEGEATLLDLYAKPTPKRLHTLTFPGLSDEYAVPYPVDKTDEMTQPVGVDEHGQLWVELSLDQISDTTSRVEAEEVAITDLDDEVSSIKEDMAINAADIATIKEDLDAFFADVSEQNNKASAELESVRAENQELLNQIVVVKAENVELADQLSAVKILLGVD